ncbi:hypothetical protein L204_105941 [Cryptococcus depauperatus]|nr:hypothetical protein L204_05064 [Cryptococcus depauperatus CBS 7855]
MSRTEFNGIVDRFGGDIAFLGTGRRKPAAPKYQLALAIHRLAHGHKVKSIAALFGVSAGTVEKWTDNSLIAIIRMLGEYVRWPSELEKDTIKRTHLSLYGIPDCLGFIDGTHINFNEAPSRVDASSYYSRKQRYGLNIVLVIDSHKYIRYVHWGFSAASSDERVQRSMRLQTDSHMFFDGLEHIIGDAEFTCTPHIIPMYRRLRNEPQLVGRPAFFNHRVKPAHVCVEHAIGILKMRWASLRNLPIKLKTVKDEARAYAFIQAAIILHNLLISTYLSVMTDQEVEEMMEKEYRMQRNDDYGYNSQSGPVEEDYRRRELLTTQMLKCYPERVDLEEWTW